MFGMCKNCLTYVLFRVIKRNPSWKVVDLFTKNTFSYAHLFVPCL
jgi:hypothetical protein